MQAARLSLVEEASEWWSAAENAYFHVCDEKDDLLRETVCALGLDGQVVMSYTVHNKQEMVDEARRVVEKVVIHRCSLTQRGELANSFLSGLAYRLSSYQQGLAVWVSHQRVDLVSSTSTFTSGDLANSLHGLASYLTKVTNWQDAIESIRAYSNYSETSSLNTPIPLSPPSPIPPTVSVTISETPTNGKKLQMPCKDHSKSMNFSLPKIRSTAHDSHAPFTPSDGISQS